MFRRDFVAHIVGAIVGFFAGVFGKRSVRVQGGRVGRFMRNSYADARKMIDELLEDSILLTELMEVIRDKFPDAPELLDNRINFPSRVAMLFGKIECIRWIPVSERMPQLGDEDYGGGRMSEPVLLFFDFGNGGHRIIEGDYRNYFWPRPGGFELGEAHFHPFQSDAGSEYVTHWAEIPAPPSSASGPANLHLSGGTVKPFHKFASPYTTATKDEIIAKLKECAFSEFHAPRP